MKFQPESDGFITALRFYKGPANTGPHVGHLWTSGGTLLAQATFTGETATGWQQVALATPVAVTAGTTYVASYHTDSGHYAFDVNYFATAPRESAAARARGRRARRERRLPLRRARRSRPAPTRRATTGSTSSSRARSGRRRSTSPRPRVTTVLPANGSSGVSAAANVTAIFSEALDLATIYGRDLRAARRLERAGPGELRLCRGHPHRDARPDRRARPTPAPTPRRFAAARAACTTSPATRSPPTSRGRSRSRRRRRPAPRSGPAGRSCSSPRTRTRSPSTTPRSCAPRA